MTRMHDSALGSLAASIISASKTALLGGANTKNQNQSSRNKILACSVGGNDYDGRAAGEPEAPSYDNSSNNYDNEGSSIKDTIRETVRKIGNAEFGDLILDVYDNVVSPVIDNVISPALQEIGEQLLKDD